MNWVARRLITILVFATTGAAIALFIGEAEDPTRGLLVQRLLGVLALAFAVVATTAGYAWLRELGRMRHERNFDWWADFADSVMSMIMITACSSILAIISLFVRLPGTTP